MARFLGIAYLVEPDGRLRNVPPPGQLQVDVGDLARRVHRSLVRDASHFQGEFGLPSHPPIQFEWVAVGQTTAVVLWSRAGRLAAVDLLLNGLDGAAEVGRLDEALRLRRSWRRCRR